MKYTIKGKVVKGNGYGNKIGFPTINLDRRSFVRMKNKPAIFGVYAGFVILNPLMTSAKQKRYRAGIVIGPLDKKNLPKIEAHILNFNKNIYGENVSLEINKFLRKFKKFANAQDLINQITKDLKKC